MKSLILVLAVVCLPLSHAEMPSSVDWTGPYSKCTQAETQKASDMDTDGDASYSLVLNATKIQVCALGQDEPTARKALNDVYLAWKSDNFANAANGGADLQRDLEQVSVLAGQKSCDGSGKEIKVNFKACAVFTSVDPAAAQPTIVDDSIVVPAAPVK